MRTERRTGRERTKLKKNNHKGHFLDEMIDDRNIDTEESSRSYYIKRCS